MPLGSTTLRASFTTRLACIGFIGSALAVFGLRPSQAFRGSLQSVSDSVTADLHGIQVTNMVNIARSRDGTVIERFAVEWPWTYSMGILSDPSALAIDACVA